MWDRRPAPVHAAPPGRSAHSPLEPAPPVARPASIPGIFAKVRVVLV